MSTINDDPPESKTSDTIDVLIPQPNIRLRATILAVLAVLFLISWPPLLAILGFGITMTAFLGTFPRSTIRAGWFEKEWFVCFWRVGASRTPLRQVMGIEVDLESRMGMFGGAILSWFIGIVNVLFIWLLDWLIPWAGGDYRLWFRNHKDERILVWQGNGESNFKHNVEVLERITGMKVTRG